MEVEVSDAIYLTQAGATTEWKGEKVTYCTTAAGGQPVIYYRGKTATIPLERLVKAMIDAIDAAMETPYD